MIAPALALSVAVALAPQPPRPIADTPAPPPKKEQPEPPAPPPAPETPPIGTWHPLTFDGQEGRTHEARLWTPEPKKANGASVLLIGGGAATDMHWTVPGSLPAIEDRPAQQVTVSGLPTRDADAIARALVERGFAVLQWSMIHRDDPAYRTNPGMAVGLGYPESVDLTRAALRLLRAQDGIEPDRVALVGHSLGATRACHVADDGVTAIVCLSGAHMSKLQGRPRDLADRALRAASDADVERNESVDADEFRMWGQRSDAPSLYLASFGEMDRDGDNVLRGWELAAQTAVVGLMRGQTGVMEPSDQLRPGLAWPSDVMLGSERPTLLLYGGLDPMSVHGPLLERAARERGATHITVEYLANLGHQLSPEFGIRVGPIDPRAVERIAAWLEQTCARPADKPDQETETKAGEKARPADK